MNQEDKLIRGNRAAHILNDDFIKEAFAHLEEVYTNAAARGANQELRNNAYFLLRALDQFKGHFQQTLTTGKLTAKHIEKLNSDKIKFFNRP